jgi:hypothetical protein
MKVDLTNLIIVAVLSFAAAMVMPSGPFWRESLCLFLAALAGATMIDGIER